MIKHGTFTLPGGGGTQNITSVGFEPGGYLLFWRPPNSSSNSGFGVYGFDGTRKFSTSTASSTSDFTRFSNTVFMACENASGSERFILEGESFLSNGFRLSTFVSNADNLSYIAFHKNINFYVDNLSITSTGVRNRAGPGFEPKLALFFWRPTDSPSASSFFMGAANGTTQFTTGYNQTSSNRQRYSSDTECLVVRGPTGGNVLSVDFNGFTSNGYSIDVKTLTSSQVISVVLIGGGDVSEILATIGDLDILSTDTTFAIDTLTSKPDGVMGVQFADSSASEGARHGFGYADRAGQSSVRWAQTSGAANRLSDTTNTFVARTSGGTNEVVAPITAFNDDGFSGTVSASADRSFKFISLEVTSIAEVEPVEIGFSLPSVTATSGGTAKVQPLNISFTIPEVTPTWVYENTATVDPINIGFTVPMVEANTLIAEPLLDTIAIHTITDSLSIGEYADAIGIVRAHDEIPIRTELDVFTVIGNGDAVSGSTTTDTIAVTTTEDTLLIR